MKSKKVRPSSRQVIPYRPCSIRMLPPGKWEKAAATAVMHNPLNRPAVSQLMQAMPGEALSSARLAVLHTKYWGVKGVKLSVGFLDSAPAALKRKILDHMNAWGKYSNVKFTLATTKPQVRISFSTPPPNDGYWSYLGTDILHVAPNEPTMNLESFSLDTPDSEFFRVVRHEAGHTLGFPHEHMRTEIINEMDREKTIAYFMRTQGWTRQEVIDQVLTPIPGSALTATEHADPHSIMCYALPAEIMLNGKAVPGGTDIDALDKKFAASVYPKKK